MSKPLSQEVNVLGLKCLLELRKLADQGVWLKQGMLPLLPGIRSFQVSQVEAEIAEIEARTLGAS